MSYGTNAGGDEYFDLRLYSDLWTNASEGNKTKARAQATRIIDRLNFAGEKHTASDVRMQLTGSRDFEICVDASAIAAAAAQQELEFPRGEDAVVPTDIEIACYEICYALLDGVDPDAEYTDQTVISQGYSSVRTTYDRTAVQEHTNAGIPSPTAWRYLKPYLRNDKGIKISRV